VEYFLEGASFGVEEGSRLSVTCSSVGKEVIGMGGWMETNHGA
jgi:hypothetical protein